MKLEEVKTDISDCLSTLQELESCRFEILNTYEDDPLIEDIEEIVDSIETIFNDLDELLDRINELL